MRDESKDFKEVALDVDLKGDSEEDGDLLTIAYRDGFGSGVVLGEVVQPLISFIELS